MSPLMTKPTKWLCAQRRLRSAWASAQSDQSLRCPHEESLVPYLPIERTAKTLIRLGRWPGWSKSSLGAHVILLVLSWGGSIIFSISRHGAPNHRNSTNGPGLLGVSVNSKSHAGLSQKTDQEIIEPPHDKTNKMTVRPAKTQISLGIRPVWSESSLCAQWVAKEPSFPHADSEDSDQTGRMPRLIWVFAVRTCHFVGFITRRLNLIQYGPSTTDIQFTRSEN